MINIQIEGGDGVVRGLRNMITESTRGADLMLTRAATDVQNKMKGEAPYRTGALSKSITVKIPSRFVRVIEPMARNIRPGNPYALPVATGSRPGYIPNVFSISQYFGVNMKVAWAIAKSIKDKGTPSHPYLSRTFSWAQRQIDRHLGNFASQMRVAWQRG